VQTSRLVSAPALLDAAHRLARQITPERIAADDTFDILDGAAGAILGLLSLYAATNDASVLDRAAACGRHLVASRVVTSVGARAWSPGGVTPLTGFSHGAAGIAYSLMRLADVTGDRTCMEAALEGFEYERRHYSEPAANWADLRPDSPHPFMTTWCHGAPGIGLARLGAIAIADTAERRDELETAMATTMRADLEATDHLCCGRAGRADILIDAGAHLGRDDWREAGHRLLSSVVAHHEATGHWRLIAGLPARVYNPVLFRGTAGIGYALLRAARPGTLPSVLKWDA
jgi:lantibiotic modifying enzyme